MCGLLGAAFLGFMIWNWSSTEQAVEWDDIVSLLGAPALLLGAWLLSAPLRSGSGHAHEHSS